MNEKKGTLYIYADGGTRNNQSKKNIGSWGAILRHNGREDFVCGVMNDTTNNRMELLSIIDSLNKVKNHDLEMIVVMDSNYVVKGVNEWSQQWKVNGWKTSKNKPIANIEYWRWLLDIVSRFSNISLTWCAGHEDNEGNNAADLICNQAMDIGETRKSNLPDSEELKELMKKLYH